MILDDKVIRDKNHKSFVHVLQEGVEELSVFHKSFAWLQRNSA